MNHPHRFILQPYAGPHSRFRCPECGHRNKTFKRYIDLETGQYLADHVGRCDREDKCGYHCTPKQYFAGQPRPAPAYRATTAADNRTYDQLHTSLLTASLMQRAYIHNNFILFLAEVYGWETALQAAERYHIGTANHWPGATVFWQVDQQGRIRTGKIMLYNKDTCKRVKEPFNHVAWAHRLVCSGQLPVSSKQSAVGSQTTANCAPPTANFLLKQCLFGEHLLNADTSATIAIAESEKTAVMASIMMPQFIWLAAGSLHGLDEDKCRVLQNREVLLFPDVGAYHHWKDCARSLNYKMPAANFTVHQEMERTATPQERANGADMADRWIGEWMEMSGKGE